MGIVCLSLIVADVVQRFVISPWVKLRPSRRIPVLGLWQQSLAAMVLIPITKIGRARWPSPALVVPPEPGHLILMNHQSIFDIILVIQSVPDAYPRIVTRARYSRSIPLISHMARLYQYPTVDPRAPRAELRSSLKELEEVGRETDVPMVVFPEGTRTRDGEISKLRTGALNRLLAARDWTVHVLVADGFWRSARFKDLVGSLNDLEGRVVHAGTLEWTDTNADPEPFVQQVRELMVSALAELRKEPTAA